MQTNVDAIKEIKKKLEGFMKEHVALQKKFNDQSAVISEAGQEKLAQEKAMVLIRQENLLLKSALQQLGPSEKKAFDQKIGDYIKSIDKAIALLSE